MNESKLFALLLVIIIISGLSLFFQLVNLNSTTPGTAAVNRVIGPRGVVENNPSFQLAPAHKLGYEFVELEQDFGEDCDSGSMNPREIGLNGNVYGSTTNGCENYVATPAMWDSVTGQITYLAEPSVSSFSSRIWGTNNLGVSVGSFFTTPGSCLPGVCRGAIWNTNGEVEVINPGSSIRLHDINDSGMAVGVTTQFGGRLGVIYYNGTYTNIGTLPGHLTSSASAINNNGQVLCGSSTNPNPGPFDVNCFWQSGVIAPLPINVRCSGVSCAGLNDNGEVAGYHSFNGVGYPALYSLINDQITQLPTPLANPSDCFNDMGKASAMNNQRDVVGYQCAGSIGKKATLWKNGIAYDLNNSKPNWLTESLDEAIEIDDSGEILVTTYSGGNYRYFLMKPI